MIRLKSKLLSLNAGKVHEAKIYNPQNGEEVRIPFRKDKTAKVVGRLAEIPPPKTIDPEDTRFVNGVLVQNDFKLSLMAPEDLMEYAGLTTTTITCKQHVTLSTAGVDLIRWALESTFGAIEEIGPSESKQADGHQPNGINGILKDPDEDEAADEEIPPISQRSFLVMGCVKVTHSSRDRIVEIEWEGNTMNDGVADAVMAVLLTVETSPAAVRYSSSKARHGHHHSPPQNPHAELSPEERFARLCMFLEEQFGQNITPIKRPLLERANSPSSPGNGSVKSDASSDDEHEEELEAKERARLAALGIPVPGLEIRVDKNIAKLWLENLEVECANNVLRDRVKAVVDRAVETVAPMWSVRGMPMR